MSLPDELASLDATAQAELVRSGAVSPTELVDAAIARIEEKNPALNAVITPLFDKARKTAAGELPDGPFRGVPFLMKDIGALTEGDPFYAGTSLLKKLAFVAPMDTYYTQKIRDAGFVICGKTNTPELGILPTTEPVAFGATKNPYDPTRSTGGSSGGSAAAVATGMVPVAHANDGGGSIRIPASCCGLVGLKPSRGRVSLGPIVGSVNGGLLAEHVVARSVRDSAALLDVLAGLMPGDPYTAPPMPRSYAESLGAPTGKLHIGVSTEFRTMSGDMADADAACVIAVAQATKLLGDLGHKVRERPLDALNHPDYIDNFLTLWATGVASRIDAWCGILGRPINADEVEPLTWALTERGRATTAPTYINCWSWMEANTRRITEYWDDFDLFMSPTVAEPPPPLGTFSSTATDPLGGLHRATRFAPFTPAFNATGQPAISLPLYRDEQGLPIGVQLVAAYGREDLLLQVAAQLEAVQPFDHLA